MAPKAGDGTLNYHLKTQAYGEVQKAKKAGLIVTPSACSRCGTTEKAIHGHHDDYAKPLDLIYLCTSCHAFRHRQLRGYTGLDDTQRMTQALQKLIDEEGFTEENFNFTDEEFHAEWQKMEEARKAKKLARVRS